MNNIMNILIILTIILIIFGIYYYYYNYYKVQNLIPKIIHQTFPTKNINSNIQNNINKLKELNPGYEYHLYDDNDIINFIKENYDDNILNTYNSINPEYGACRADYFRYLLMYEKGGIYLDIKSSCEKPFDSIIKPEDEYILTHWGNHEENMNDIITPHNELLNNKYGEYCNWNIIIKKKHPLMKEIIDQVTNNINNYSIEKYGVGKYGVLLLTGPIIYTQTILNNNYKLNIYNNYYDIGLVYNTTKDHTKLFKKHYSYLISPIILKHNL
tara:strand:+ start:585 stop:1394 length:810 start_codon:yes stop_codon:yes gene_type:complete